MKESKTGRVINDLRTEVPFHSRLKSPQGMHTFVAILIFSGAILVSTLCPSASAEEIVYDNTGRPHNGELFLPASGDDLFTLFAQPFQLGDNNTVSSISLRLGRWDGTEGPVSGPMPFSIWDDDGNGLPGQLVRELGVVDVSMLPNFKPNVPINLETVVLDFPVAGLTPTETYYVVGDTRVLDGVTPPGGGAGNRDSVLVPFLSSSIGTNGDGLWISRDAIEWVSPSVIGAGRRFLQTSVTANTTAFHNLHVESDDYVNVLGADRRHAQQFQMDGRGSLDEVTVSLSRQGSASGSMAFEIWSDNGSHTPIQKVADLGTIADVSQIPTAHTTFTFGDEITGLNGSGDYWVVANYSGLTGSLDEDNSVGWTVILSDEGATGTANARGSVDSGETWIDLSDAFGIGGPFKFKMSVVTGGSIRGIDYNEDGQITAADIDLLTEEIHAGTNGPEFDLTDDTFVDQEDLSAWLSGAAARNGFGEAYLHGDSNLDGSVNAIDLNNLALNWQRNDEPNWSGGDFNADGNVNAVDLNELGINWQQSISLAAAQSVPEPSGILMLLVAGSLAVVSRKNSSVERRS